MELWSVRRGMEVAEPCYTQSLRDLSKEPLDRRPEWSFVEGERPSEKASEIDVCLSPPY